MKRFAWHVALCLLASCAMLAHAGQNADQSQGQNQPKQERPTLGPQPGPGIDSAPPSTAATTDVRRLLRIHTIFVESMDNGLSDKLVEALGKWGRFKLVTSPKSADATVRGSCLDSHRLKHVHTEIFIADKSGASVWQDTIYRPFNPPTLDQAVADTATLVAEHLQQSVHAAESR